MNIFEVVGPVMVGPSSSHTAGAVKIGYISFGAGRDQPAWLLSCDRGRTRYEKSAGGRTFRYADRRYPHPTGTGDR